MPVQDEEVSIKLDGDADEGPVAHGLLKSDDVLEDLRKLGTRLFETYERQNERREASKSYWDVFNCVLNEHQTYNGISQLYLPIVHNAVQARKVRFVNQMFPQNSRHAEVLSLDGTRPAHTIATLEHYIRTLKLRTSLMPQLMVNGDVEGQYTIGVSWRTSKRRVTRRLNVAVHPRTGEPLPPGAGALMSETIVEGSPHIEIIPDGDFVVFPEHAASIQDALDMGGGVAVLRRWTKARIKALKEDGTLDKTKAEDLLKQLQDGAHKTTIKNRRKQQVEATGVKLKVKDAEVYEVWTMVDGPDGEELCQVFITPNNMPVGCRPNPYWCGHVPFISAPVRAVEGSFKGDSLVKFCADAQYAANDAVNEGMDSAAYSLLPIIMTDPEKNPRTGSMILALAAVWETSPKDTQFAQFPQLWEQAFNIVAACKAEIQQTLSVSPAAITQQTQKKKPSAAEMATEQAIDLLTTADAVRVVEESILSPLLEWLAHLDYQYRDRELITRKAGPIGVKEEMQRVPPLQLDGRYEFNWVGAEAQRNAAQVQNMIAGLNILRGIPPQMYQGYKLNIVPVISSLVETTFGPRMAPLIFESAADQQPLDPGMENQMLLDGFEVPVSPLDDDRAHLAKHMPALQLGGPAAVYLKQHVSAHAQAMAQKAAMQQAQQAPGGPGGPGGAGGPGQTPPGSQPNVKRQGGMQRPPGALHRDQQPLVPNPKRGAMA